MVGIWRNFYNGCFVFLLSILNMFSKLGHGSKEFLIVRICAVLILSYTLYLASFLFFAEEVNFNRWSAFFENPFNKAFTSIFFLAFSVHTWLGTWAVASDYLTPRIFGNKGKVFYISFRAIVAAIIALVLTWAVIIIW